MRALNEDRRRQRRPENQLNKQKIGTTITAISGTFSTIDAHTFQRRSGLTLPSLPASSNSSNNVYSCNGHKIKPKIAVRKSRSAS